MQDTAEQLLSGDAWRQFCDRLKQAGDTILSDDYPASSRERSEGFRSLTRLLSYAMQMEIECADPAFPQLFHHEQPHNQWGGPNPDNGYLRASIHPDHAYRVWGTLAGVRQMILSLHEGDMQLGQFGVYSEQTLSDWELGPNGELEVFVSKEKPEYATNWMPLHEDARIFSARIYVSDWENDACPTLHIERLGAEGLAAPPLEPAALASALERSVNWVEKSAEFWNRYTGSAWARATPNALDPARSAPGGADHILYGNCCWELAEDEALVVNCEAPEAEYYNFCIHTLGGLESGDFANRQVSLSDQQLHVDDDGCIRLVLSARDPGVPNWIDNEGRERGMLVYRFVWATTNPKPEGRVVKVDQVRSLVPDGHPTIDANERRRRLSARREQFWNRSI